MNLFLFAGDMCHVFSIVVLLLRLRVSKNAIGISVKTQELHLIVFLTRYSNLYYDFVSYYNSLMKILYISSTVYIIYMIKRKEPYKSNIDEAGDSFLHYRFAVAPCVVLALLTKFIESFYLTEVKLMFGLTQILDSMPLLWTFSIYLEAIAIIPQIIVLERYRKVENLPGTLPSREYKALLMLNNPMKMHRKHDHSKSTSELLLLSLPT